VSKRQPVGFPEPGWLRPGSPSSYLHQRVVGQQQPDAPSTPVWVEWFRTGFGTIESNPVIRNLSKKGGERQHGLSKNNSTR